MVSLGERIPVPALAAHPDSPHSVSCERHICALFWLLAILFGALQVWAHRFDVAPDGISYIEIARAGGHDFINGYWSPLYPLLLRLLFRIFPTSLYWESTVVHFANLAIFLASLACFEVFLAELLRARQASPELKTDDAFFSTRDVCAAGYVFFLWSGHFWVTPAWVTPDLLVGALSYLATAVLLRIYRGAANWLTFALLGVFLGLAYLAKTPMFLLAFVFIACAAVLCSSKKVMNVSIALVFFLAIAAPFVFRLSSAKGRLTFGDSGEINYAEFVDGAPKYVHWRGEPPGTGVPAHPTREILVSPTLYEFATPIRGSYPPWHDPSYWYEGIRPHFSLQGQLLALYRTASAYLRIVSVTGTLYVVFVLLLFLAKRKQVSFRNFGADGRIGLVWLPAYVALAMYALVHVEPRFVGGFLLMLLMNFLAQVRSLESKRLPWSPKIRYAIVLAPAIAVVCSAALSISRAASSKAFEQWEVAQALRNMGISAGSRVGCIGTGLDAYWAHLGQLRIVAEIPDSSRASFLQASNTQQNDLGRRFHDIGVSAVLTKFPDVARSGERWEQIAGTRYFVWRLPPKTSDSK